MSDVFGDFMIGEAQKRSAEIADLMAEIKRLRAERDEARAALTDISAQLAWWQGMCGGEFPRIANEFVKRIQSRLPKVS